GRNGRGAGARKRRGGDEAGEAGLSPSVVGSTTVRVDERTECPLERKGAGRVDTAVTEVVRRSHVEHAVWPASGPAGVVIVQLLAEEAVGGVVVQVVVDVDAHRRVSGVPDLVVDVHGQALELDAIAEAARVGELVDLGDD